MWYAVETVLMNEAYAEVMVPFDWFNIIKGDSLAFMI